MKLDVTAALGAVTRVVETRDREGKPARVLTASRTYDTDRADLWDALTNPERIPRWFLPVEGDLRAGGRYQTKGNAGGTILRCTPPERFDLTWEMHGDVSWVVVTLAELAPDRTRLALEHSAHPPEELWDKYGPGALGVGWELGLAALSVHLATGATLDAAAEEAWTTGTEEGRALVRGASEGWGEAAIRGGADRAAAEASARRTTAFYAGQPEPT